MKNAMTAAETTNEEHSTEALEFVELGRVSEETKGSWPGVWDDGWDGKFSA